MPSRSAETGLYVAKQSATFEVGGQPVFVHPGMIVRAGHPVLADHAYLFEELIIRVDLEPDLPPGKATVTVVGGGVDLPHGVDAVRVIVARTRPAVLW